MAHGHSWGFLPACHEVVYSSRDGMLPNWQQKPPHNSESKRGESNMENTSNIVLREVMMSDLPILFNGSVAGSVSSYVDEDEHREVSYWLGKLYWGKGIATCALSAFLEHSKVRPLYARAAKDNIGSLRVLEKCGFTRIGEGRGFSEARGEEVEEFLLRLD